MRVSQPSSRLFAKAGAYEAFEWSSVSPVDVSFQDQYERIAPSWLRCKRGLSVSQLNRAEFSVEQATVLHSSMRRVVGAKHLSP
jgi:hypothetical protein